MGGNMKFDKYFAYAGLLIFTLCKIASAQPEIMTFELLDSIQSTATHYCQAKDLTNDGYDEIILSNNRGIFIYNGIDRHLSWADTVHTADTTWWFDIGDIEQDGQWELFASSVNNREYSLFIYPSLNIDARYAWPGYCQYLPDHLHFYTRDGVPYLDFLMGYQFGYKLNLANWHYSIATVVGRGIGYFGENLYLFNTYYNDIDLYSITSMYHYDLDFSQEGIEYITSVQYPHNTSFSFAIGNFLENEDVGIFYHSMAYDEEDTVYLNIHLWDENLESIFFREIPDILYPRKFIAVNLVGDPRDELLIVGADANDSLGNRNLLLDDNAEILAGSVSEPIGNYKLRCNLDDDEYDEIIAYDNNNIYLYNVEFHQVGIEPDNVIPENFSCKLYPNPFNSQIRINFDLKEDAKLVLDIYNVLGQRITSLNNGYTVSGHKSYTWNPQGFNCNSGIYFLKAWIGNKSVTERMVYIK